MIDTSILPSYEMLMGSFLPLSVYLCGKWPKSKPFNNQGSLTAPVQPLFSPLCTYLYNTFSFDFPPSNPPRWWQFSPTRVIDAVHVTVDRSITWKQTYIELATSIFFLLFENRAPKSFDFCVTDGRFCVIILVWQVQRSEDNNSSVDNDGVEFERGSR